MIFEIVEKMVITIHGTVPNGNLAPRQRREIWDELIKKEKEMANEIYIQRCLEKYE